MSGDLRTRLTDHPFFTDIGDAALDAVEAAAKVVSYPADRLVFAEGRPADRLFGVVSGRVALALHAPGRGTLVVDTVGPGEVLGVSWMFPPHRWAFDARTVEPVTALAVDAASLRIHCDLDPVFGRLVLQRLGLVMQRRMQSARTRLLDLYGHAGAR
jgi:CRP/FNR family transcriptional regulator, cyclic AMP receptor protein